MSYDQENQHNLAYFKMNMLQAEIEMHGMIAENKILEQKGEPIKYNKDMFDRLIEKYAIHHNQFPFIKS